jgi:hypothetical protein
LINAGISTSTQTQYIPGDSVGLRLLTDCFTTPCTDILGSTLNLSATPALLVVLTANRDNLVDWVEQVGQPSTIPLLAGVTQSVTPLVRPYVANGQISGLIDGAPAAASYQERVGLATDTTPLFAAQFVKWGVILLLIGGNIYYFLISNQQPKLKKSAPKGKSKQKQS